MKAATPVPLCVPTPVIWQQPKEGVLVGPFSFRVLLEDSKAKCLFGGTISIHFSKEAAMAAAPWGSFKKPSEYISDFFTWAIDGAKDGLASTKTWLAEKGAPQWLLDSVDGLEWYVEFELGLAEGAINAVVGLVEVVYDITQDPVGIGEAIVDGVCKGAEGAYKWATKGDNWKKAADDTWKFMSDPKEWENAANDAGEWVKNNPRKLGNVAGEIVETAAEIALTAGSATAAKAGGKVAKEVVETVVEKGAKEVGEKATKELGEKAVMEIVEDVAEKGGGKIARVITETVIPGIKDFAKWFDNIPIHEFDEIWKNKKLREAIEARIRHPGGLHEWLMCSRANVFKKWGVSMDEIKRLRTKIDDVIFKNPPGNHGGLGSTKAHNEILDIIDNSTSYDQFKNSLKQWADHRLEGGSASLPNGF
jgi:hypothetical protein